MRYSDFLIPAIEAAGYSRINKNPVYIVLTRGHSALSGVIMKSTGDSWSHSTIAFNPELDPCYSFGTKDVSTNRNQLGFIQTNPRSNLWFSEKNAVPYSIYVCFVSDEALRKMRARLDDFTKNPNKYKYSFAGLLRVFLKLKSRKNNKWFCSMFVAEILGAGKDLGKDSSLYRPETLTEISDVTFLTSGANISDYDADEVRQLTKEIRYV